MVAVSALNLTKHLRDMAWRGHWRFPSTGFHSRQILCGSSFQAHEGIIENLSIQTKILPLKNWLPYFNATALPFPSEMP